MGLQSGDILGIGTAISGIAGAIGTGYAANKNLKAVRETNRANLDLARQQNDWNIQQWEREMDYNSPANKLRLLEEAGLNPVWYGQGLGPTETQAPQSADLANQQAPQLDVGAIGSSLANMSSSLIAAGEYKIKNKEIELRNRELDLLENRIRNEGRDIDNRGRLYDEQIKNLETERNLTSEKIKEVGKNIDVMTQQIDNLSAQAELARAQTLESKNKAYNEYWTGERIRQMIPLELKNLAAATGLTVQETAESVAKMNNFIMDTNLKEVQIDLGHNQTLLISRQADGQLYLNDIARIDANWRGRVNCMTVVTGYVNAASGLISSVGNLVDSFWGPLGKMRSAIGKGDGGFKLNMSNPFNTWKYDPYQSFGPSSSYSSYGNPSSAW